MLGIHKYIHSTVDTQRYVLIDLVEDVHVDMLAKVYNIHAIAHCASTLSYYLPPSSKLLESRYIDLHSYSTPY